MQIRYRIGSIETKIWVGFTRFESEYGSIKKFFEIIYLHLIGGIGIH